MVIDMDTRHLEALREITHKSDLALRRVTDGMRSFREEVRVLKAMTNGIPGLLDVKDRERTAIRKTEGGHSETSNPTNY